MNTGGLLKKLKKITTKKKSKQTKTLLRAPDRTCFFLLWCANKLEKDFVQTTPLRNIWYCFYWLLFPISDFNMIQHFWHHVWTVLKRNVLCQASATFTDLQDKKNTTQKTFPKNVPLSKTFWVSQKQDRFWFGKKGHRRFDCHTHLGQFYIWYIYIKPLWLKSSSRFTCKWILKRLFFVCCLSLLMKKPFFGTYALDISSLTSSIKYISEK